MDYKQQYMYLSQFNVTCDQLKFALKFMFLERQKLNIFCILCAQLVYIS